MLANVIESNEAAKKAAESADWSGCAAALNAREIPVKDTTLRDSNWISTQLTTVVDPKTGATEADIVLGTLQSAQVPRVQAAYLRLVTVGLDLSNDQIQATVPLLAMAGGWPEGLAAKVLAAGIRMESAASVAGLESVTADDCKAAYEAAQLSAIADDYYQSAVTRYNAAKSGISDGSLTTAAEVLAVLEGE